MTYAIYRDNEWIKDVEADSEVEALAFDPEVNRVELISENSQRLREI